MTKLSVVFGEYPHAQGVLDGSAALAGYEVEPVQVSPVIGAYRRMIRDLEFDVCELAPVSYLMARSAGIPLTAIPVFLNRRFHHGDIQCGPHSGIRFPRDVEGKRVGVRAYTVTTGVWARGLLTEDYGVDIDKITWVTDDDDHIEGYAPGNVERVTTDQSLGELLRLGEIDAAFSGNAGTGRAGAPRAGWLAGTAADSATSDAYPLFPDSDVLEADSYQRTGIYPLHSVIAIRADLVEREPDLPSALYAAMVQAKRGATVDPESPMQKRFAKQAAQVDGDPIPYGLESNARSIAALVRFARAQGILGEGFTEDIAQLFAAGNYPDA